ncbi:MAG: methyltransferase type 11 [Parcubacteria group bacterium]|nr:methyltransferase type 11 [Parcubacteria group bacterium]
MNNDDPQVAPPYLERSERPSQHGRIRDIYQKVNYGELLNPHIASLFSKYFLRSDVILDLGSSNGRIFPILNSIGISTVHGADIADYLTLGRPSASFKTFDFSTDRFPYDDESFDGITSIEVIEHLENPYHFLRECARILKPGGILILSTPNPDHIFNKISFFLHGRFYRFLDGNDHIMLFSDHILSKGAKKFFNLIAREYMFGELPYRVFSRFKYPENRFFGRTAFYILQKKQD